MSSLTKDAVPAPYRLVASHYEGGSTRHVLADAVGVEHECLVAGGEDDARTVEKFCQALTAGAVTVVERPGKRGKP